MTDEFLNFDNNQQITFDDLNFNFNDVTSTIPENELLDFASPLSTNQSNVVAGAGGSMQGRSNSINPSQLLQNSLQNSYKQHFGSVSNTNEDQFSPLNSPYSTSLNNRAPSSFHDTLNSPDIITNSYLSPPVHAASINRSLSGRRQSSIASPQSSYNDHLSPYGGASSYDTLKSPSLRSIGGLPGTTPSSVPNSQLSKEEKIRRRREFHNQVERRRRDLIKERIKELGTIVPPSLLLVDSKGREVKPSKSVIINKTVDYLEHLHKVMAHQQEKKLQLLKRIAELEQFPDASPNVSDPSPATSSTTPHFQDDLSGETFDVNDFLNDHKAEWNI